jgi:hypothetical protein
MQGMQSAAWDGFTTWDWQAVTSIAAHRTARDNDGIGKV